MNEASSEDNPPPYVAADEEFREESNMSREEEKIMLPEDGHVWKKYGQKYIKRVAKWRSYFKCHESNCTAKKKVDWSTSDPSDLQITYLDDHTHGSSTWQQFSSQQDGSTLGANEYNLLTQLSRVSS